MTRIAARIEDVSTNRAVAIYTLVSSSLVLCSSDCARSKLALSSENGFRGAFLVPLDAGVDLPKRTPALSWAGHFGERRFEQQRTRGIRDAEGMAAGIPMMTQHLDAHLERRLAGLRIGGLRAGQLRPKLIRAGTPNEESSVPWRLLSEASCPRETPTT